MEPTLKTMEKFAMATMASILCVMTFDACNSSAPSEASAMPATVTAVHVTSVLDSSLAEYVDLSAVSAYLEKNDVKASINGYVASSNIHIGQKVTRGQELFTLITKEAQSIGNAINKLDPAFKFSGVSVIRAAAAGTVVQVNHQKGDYVQDGEPMATINNHRSLAFLLDLPYELTPIMASNTTLEIKLPDGLLLYGSISGTLPSVDSMAQTERYILKVNSHRDIPEGLIASVRLIKVAHNHVQALPKSAILANETEDEFWLMKMINDSTAVKVKIDKGIENNTTIEVLRPRFLKSDKIITSGNYGLSDTAKVKIIR